MFQPDRYHFGEWDNSGGQIYRQYAGRARRRRSCWSDKTHV